MSETHDAAVGHESGRGVRPVVGVVGLGAMGAPVVGHLLRAGLPVVVADLDEQAVRAAVEAGARSAADVGELARSCDVVLVVVPSDEDVLAVCEAGGLLAGCRPGTAVLLCSSVRPDTCEAVQRAAPDGVGVLDAALTGGVRGAISGHINLLVGGDEAVLDRVRPALEPWTASVHHLGGLGAGDAELVVHDEERHARRAEGLGALDVGPDLGGVLLTAQHPVDRGRVEAGVDADGAELGVVGDGYPSTLERRQ